MRLQESGGGRGEVGVQVRRGVGAENANAESELKVTYS